MKGNLTTVILAAGVMAVTAVSVHAESGNSGSNQDPDKFHWRQVESDISPSEYRKTYRHNKRVIRSALMSYSQHAAKSIGLSENAGRLAGGAAGVAASLLTNRSLRFRLNEKKTFAFEVKDPVANDRALYLNYRLKW